MRCDVPAARESPKFDIGWISQHPGCACFGDAVTLNIAMFTDTRSAKRLAAKAFST